VPTVDSRGIGQNLTFFQATAAHIASIYKMCANAMLPIGIVRFVLFFKGP
jgi:hypothetical protein